MERSPMSREDERRTESGALPREYDREIIDDKGNRVMPSVVNGKHLYIYTRIPPKNDVADHGISIPVADTLRLIMHIAAIVQFSGVLDEHDNEILRAIEVIARRGIR